MAFTYDRKENKYITPITDVSSRLNGTTDVKTKAENPIRGSSKFLSSADKAFIAAKKIVENEKTAREQAVKKLESALANSEGLFETLEVLEDKSVITYLHDKPLLEESKVVIKLTSNAIGVSNDGGETYPYGFVVDGTLITRLLYAEGINADYIDSGALTVRDSDGNIIFQADMNTKKVYLDGSVQIGGGKSIGLNGESFVFITDPHWDLGNAKQSPKLIKYIKEKTNIDNIICGGDIINEGLHDTMLNVFLDFVNKMKKIGIPFPIAFGNHDMNTNANNPQSEWFDRNTVFNIEYKHVAKFITFISPENDFSFIYDRPEIKTRFIFIDTQKNGSIKWEAITPISESFNKVPEDYKVVVVCHWVFGDNSILTGWGQRILDTIDAYNARTTYTNDQTRTYDYTNANGKCVLVCCGHTHYDTQIVTNGGVPVLNTTCDNYNRSNSGLERKKGTITEQAFDVISVNYADDSVKVVRIGSGNDRIFSQGKWEVIN